MKNKKRKIMMSVCGVLAAIAFCAGAGVNALPVQQASALIDPSAAVQAGGGAELWNSNSAAFNGEVMEDLVDKLFGQDDPVEYIKQGWDEGAKSFVVSSPAIRERVNNENGLTVTLGGLQWSVASLTLAEIDDEENVVATLYLTDALPKSMTVYYNNANDVKGINMYSRSTLRKTLLGRSDMQLFAGGAFAQNYLVQPKYVPYQQNESMYGRDVNWYNCPNDALGSLTDGWYRERMNYQPGDVMNDETVRYEDWGNDYVWIPSIAEVGAGNGAADETCIWQLNKAIRSHTAGGWQANYAWYRSGNQDYLNRAYILHRDGRFYNELVTNTYTIRPAIHLNLSAAALGQRGVVLEEPQDVTTAFNGGVQSIACPDISPYPSWYRAGIYSDATKVKIEYDAPANTVGEYWAKITLLDSWVERAVKQAQEKCDAAGITGAEKEAYVARMTPKFGGSADTSDPAYVETDRVRYVKHTVAKRVIGVPSGGSLVYNGAVQQFLPASFDGKYVNVVGDNTGKDADAYAFKLALKFPDDTVWEGTSSVEIGVNWTMEKYKLLAKWNFGGDYPQFILPAGVSEGLELEYIYLDAQGKEIEKSAMKLGETYQTVACLAGEKKNNFEFVDAKGNVLSNAERSEPVSFENKVETEAPKKGCSGSVEGGITGALCIACAVATALAIAKKSRSVK